MDPQERKVPVLRSENSLIEQEFDSIRDKFEAEMRKMEEEMTRFRSQLLATSERHCEQKQHEAQSSSEVSASGGAESRTQHSLGCEESSGAAETISSATDSRSLASSSRVTSSRTTTTTRRTTTKSLGRDEMANEGARRDDYRLKVGESPADWIAQLDSPLIKDDAGGSGGKMLRLRFDVSQYKPEQIIVKTVDNRLQVQAKREERTDTASRYLEYNREFLLPEGTEPERIRSSLSADGVLTVEAPLPSARGFIQS